MRFRFQKRRHLILDIGTGDILAERGDVLITGRISARSPLSSVIKASRREEMEKLFLKPTLHFRCEEGVWRHVFSIHWTARDRYAPDTPSYQAPVLAMQQIAHYLSTTGLLAGDIRVGMTPFSWRTPQLTAQIMRDCLWHLFLCARDHPRGNTSMHVSVKSLTEFPELTDLLVRDLPVKHGPLGFPLTPWVPDDSEVEPARV